MASAATAAAATAAAATAAAATAAAATAAAATAAAATASAATVANANNIPVTRDEFMAYLAAHPGANFMALYPQNVFVKAIRDGNTSLVRKMIQKGINVNVNAMLEGGHYLDSYPIFAAIKKGDIEIVEMLLDAGADVNFTSGGTVPLELAIREDRADMVKLFLDRGATMQYIFGGYTPLTFAIYKGNMDVVRELLRPGLIMQEEHEDRRGRPYMKDISLIAKDDTEDRTPLVAAAAFDKPEIAQLLIAAKADIHQESSRGDTPLSMAMYKRHHRVLKVLLEAGIDVHAPYEEGKSLLDLAKEGRFSDEINKTIVEEARRRRVQEGELMEEVLKKKGVSDPHLTHALKRYLRANDDVMPSDAAVVPPPRAGAGAGTRRRRRRARSRRSRRNKY
jgi:ankyrin repeat protein